MKRLNFVLVLVLALVALSGLASAQATVEQVYVNNMDAKLVNGVSTSTAYVERGEDVLVEVHFVGGHDTNGDGVVNVADLTDVNADGVVDLNDALDYEDVEIEVELNGYDHDEIRLRKEINIRETYHGTSVFRLEVPQDMDANEDYDLTVSIEGQTGATIALRVEEKPHKLNIYDALISPTKLVAGKPVFVSVLVENMGANEEERATISLSIPELGVETTRFLDELETVDTNDKEQDDNDQIVDLSLDIPASAKSGEYELVIRTTYDRGHTETEKVYTVLVEGVEEQVEVTQPVESLIANVDITSQSVEQGQGAVYTLSLANMGQVAKSYTFAVEGVDFGSVRVDPQTVSLNKDESRVVLVYVSPAENAALGAKAFTVKLMEGNTVAKQFALTANVVEGSKESGNYEAFKKVLEVGFIVLLIILVILGIVVVAKKLASDDDDEGIEGQTYY